MSATAMFTTLSTVPETGTSSAAVMRAREALVPAGLAISEAAFRELSPAIVITHLVKDGQPVKAGQDLMRIEGTGARYFVRRARRLEFRPAPFHGIATLDRTICRSHQRNVREHSRHPQDNSRPSALREVCRCLWRRSELPHRPLRPGSDQGQSPLPRCATKNRMPSPPPSSAPARNIPG